MKIYWNWKPIGRIGIGSPIISNLNELFKKKKQNPSRTSSYSCASSSRLSSASASCPSSASALCPSSASALRPSSASASHSSLFPRPLLESEDSDLTLSSVDQMNDAVTRRIFSKLDNLKTLLEKVKKNQEDMKEEIKTIKEEVAILSHDQACIDVNLLEKKIYSNYDEFKKSAEFFLKESDNEFFFTLGSKWEPYFKKKIQKPKLAVSNCFRKLFEKIEDDENDTYMTKIIKNVWPKKKNIPNLQITWAISISEIFLNPKNEVIKMSEEIIQPAFARNLRKIENEEGFKYESDSSPTLQGPVSPERQKDPEKQIEPERNKGKKRIIEIETLRKNLKKSKRKVENNEYEGKKNDEYEDNEGEEGEEGDEGEDDDDEDDEDEEGENEEYHNEIISNLNELFKKKKQNPSRTSSYSCASSSRLSSASASCPSSASALCPSSASALRPSSASASHSSLFPRPLLESEDSDLTLSSVDQMNDAVTRRIFSKLDNLKTLLEKVKKNQEDMKEEIKTIKEEVAILSHDQACIDVKIFLNPKNEVIKMSEEIIQPAFARNLRKIENEEGFKYESDSSPTLQGPVSPERQKDPEKQIEPERNKGKKRIIEIETLRKNLKKSKRKVENNEYEGKKNDEYEDNEGEEGEEGDEGEDDDDEDDEDEEGENEEYHNEIVNIESED
ncbi:hypothetical protein Glove_183g37 [Diversispora epigaea]|uniref:Uncharacterized protein n=1 Tax=Diversispora epigaea TaxID=1348612 RepID=A0A397IX96_9GLOM|nr:hypothetical protein Glove_183g37 [Diversispora epigaea]